MNPKTLTVNQKHQIYFTYLLLKRKLKKNQIYYIMLRKNQRSLKINRFVMICLLQLRLIFCCSCVLRLACLLQLRLIFSALASCTAHIRERERERELKKEMKRKKQKVRWVLLLSHCCTCTKTCGCNFKMCGWWESWICRIKNVWRGKNIKWVMILLLMVHLLFVI